MMQLRSPTGFPLLRAASEEHIDNVFKEYRAEKYPVVKEAFKSSQMFTRNVGKDCDTYNALETVFTLKGY